MLGTEYMLSMVTCIPRCIHFTHTKSLAVMYTFVGRKQYPVGAGTSQ